MAEEEATKLNSPRERNPDALRRCMLVGGAATLLMPKFVLGRARPTVRIGVPTKTYFPTIIAETAIRQKLFEKEGVSAELTIYRSAAQARPRRAERTLRARR